MYGWPSCLDSSYMIVLFIVHMSPLSQKKMHKNGYFLHYFNEISKVATMPSILGLQVKNTLPNLDNTFINAHLLNSN
jgi:hypothetical protein